MVALSQLVKSREHESVVLELIKKAFD